MDTADPALQSTDAVFQGCIGTSGDRGGRPGAHDGSSPLANSLTCCPCRPGVEIEEARAMANRYWNFPQICDWISSFDRLTRLQILAIIILLLSGCHWSISLDREQPGRLKVPAPQDKQTSRVGITGTAADVPSEESPAISADAGSIPVPGLLPPMPVIPPAPSVVAMEGGDVGQVPPAIAAAPLPATVSPEAPIVLPGEVVIPAEPPIVSQSADRQLDAAAPADPPAVADQTPATDASPTEPTVPVRAHRHSGIVTIICLIVAAVAVYCHSLKNKGILPDVTKLMRPS